MGEQGTASECNELDTLVKSFSLDQLRYLAVRPYCATDKEACAKINKSQSTVSRWPNKADVDRAVQLMALDGVIVSSEIFRRNLAKASQEIVDQLDHKSVNVRYRAAVEVKDTAMGKPTQRLEAKTEHSGEIKTENVNSDQHNRAILTLAETLRAILPGQSAGGDSDVDAAE